MPVPFAIFFLAAATASLAYLLCYCHRPPGAAKSSLKTAATALLALAALAGGGPGLLVVALGLGALGDFLLSRSGGRAFLAGLVAFAAAHLAYLGLFLQAGASIAVLTAVPVAVPTLILCGVAGAMALPLWRQAGPLRVPVMAYIAIILAMGIAALALPAAIGTFPRFAACLFIASDAILAAELFLLPAVHPARRYSPFAVWTLYWMAQAMFLLAFLPDAEA